MAAPSGTGRVLKFVTTNTTTDTLYIESVRWVGPSTAAHTAVLTNTAGDTIWAATASTTKQDECKALNGISSKGLIATLGSGTLYVYIR